MVMKVKIGGFEYTPEQLQAAVDAAFLLCVAYEKAEPLNGGGESVDWNDVNTAFHRAQEAFSFDDYPEVVAEAKRQNGR